MPAISCVIITKNEEAVIRQTLESLRWCEDVVVVDSGSTDKTLEICKEFGIRVYHHDWEGFGLQKQYAVSLAKHDWVFNTDADEALSPELGLELQHILESHPSEQDVYFVPINVVFMEKLIKTSNKQGLIRLFNKKFSNFSSHTVHEYVKYTGNVRYLKNPLLHRSYRDLDHYLAKFNQYTTLAARELYEKGKRTTLFYALMRFPFDFFLYYFFRGYIRRGRVGLIWSFLCGFYPAIKYLKLYELQRKAKLSKP